MQHPTRKSSKSLASKQRLPGIQRSRNTIQNKNNKSDRLIEIDPEFTDIRISRGHLYGYYNTISYIQKLTRHRRP